MLTTEFDFFLPRGLIDEKGNIHRHGVMRLATAKDEIAVSKDRRIQDSTAYTALVMLSRVIVRLGDLSQCSPELLENLFSLDLGYLREFYNRINQQGNIDIPVHCPQCNHRFQTELVLSGES
ncbi:hypothetical protein [Calothrix sp. 336/3]|uniref:hypothetical protein n=1 Tax=Calothrix sp. 336/3 TaxID=1337936 RepID=UPI0004E294DC|nr:hypothetical protein [Calothrix sp. 336/3]AKG20501.1 hypothetical protein IJ00_03495 [Calothrix sp. 336/3]